METLNPPPYIIPPRARLFGQSLAPPSRFTLITTRLLFLPPILHGGFKKACKLLQGATEAGWRMGGGVV